MTERARYWQGVVAEWWASGQTQVAFCRQRRIQAGTFAWWKRQLRQAGWSDVPDQAGRRHAGSKPGVSGFVEVSSASPAPGHFEVVLGGGRAIRVPAGFEAGELARLLAVLEGPC